MRKLITSSALMITLLCHNTAYASPYAIAWQPAPEGPVVTFIEEGQPAPFAGTLFNLQAAAELSVEREQAEARCQIEIDRQIEIQRAEKQLEIDNLAISLSGEAQRRALEASMAERRIDGLMSDLERSNKQANAGRWAPLWFVGGVVGGVLIMVGGAYIVREINR